MPASSGVELCDKVSDLQLSEKPVGLRSSGKRKDYLEWQEYFMMIAKVAAQRSKDPVTQVGSVIVKDQKVVGTGYNGFPRGCDDDIFPWGKGNPDPKMNKHMFVVHAEANAIINSVGVGALEGATIFTTLFPCNECAKLIIQAGIKRVVFGEDRASDEFEVAKIMFSAAGVVWDAFSSTKDITVSLNK